MKLNDKILIFGVLIIAIVLWMVLSFREAGKEAVIYQDGEEIYRLDLGEETHLTLEYIKGQENVIAVKNGNVSVTSATCPDQICVRQGAVSETGETIVCLPHKLVIEIQ